MNEQLCIDFDSGSNQGLLAHITGITPSIKKNFCAHCGCELVRPTQKRRGARSKYCSDKCYLESGRNGTSYNNCVLTQCNQCGKDYVAYRNGSRYCSTECSREARGKNVQCKYCSKDFFKYDSNRVYCSCECAVLGRSYGTKDHYDEIVGLIKSDLESGMPTKRVKKKHGVAYTAVKRVIDQEYGGNNPQHVYAAKLYQDGKTESEIAAMLKVGEGGVVSWLLRLVPSYCKPVKEPKPATFKDATPKVATPQDRAATAAALRLYRKVKNARTVCAELGMSLHKIMDLLGKTKGYARIRRGISLGKYTSEGKKRKTISTKYTNEKHFSDTLAATIADTFPLVSREVSTGSTTRIDVVVVRHRFKAVIECKWDVKITNIHKSVGQSLIAKNKLGASHAFVCWPDDVHVSREAIKDCRDAGVYACKEGDVVLFLENCFSGVMV
jgi:hypothetical protein